MTKFNKIDEKAFAGAEDFNCGGAPFEYDVNKDFTIVACLDNLAILYGDGECFSIVNVPFPVRKFTECFVVGLGEELKEWSRTVVLTTKAVQEKLVEIFGDSNLVVPS